jgi:hypothetical protein
MYFRTIPTFRYETFDGSGHSKVVTNIFTRVRAKLEAITDRAVFYTYDLLDGQSPEVVAWKYYGSAEYTWVVLLFNNVLDPVFDWVLNHHELDSYIANKYGSLESAHSTPHHHETKELLAPIDGYGYNRGDVVLPSGIEVPSGFTFSYGTNASPYEWSGSDAATEFNQYDYEVAQNEKKRSIKLLRRDFLPQFIEEFETLVRSKVR